MKLIPLKSLSSRVSSKMSNIDSHLTILRPTESTPSDGYSFYGAVMEMDDRDAWKHRAKFLCRTLSFCLGPGNIWRFPRQAFSFGNATYIYLYSLYIWLFGISLFVFELGQSQYYGKGFARLYTICPVMEGITLSMVLYCLVTSILYNMINIYSFLYLFSTFYKKMPHSYCSSQIGSFCNSTNQTETTEQVYFHYYIVRAADIQPEKAINWRNVGVLILIGVLICLIMVFAVLKTRSLLTITCATLLLTLFTIAVLSCTMEGTPAGMSKMFIPLKSDLANLTVWLYPFEQSLVSLGIGVGPLTTFWSLSKMKFLSYKDCIMLNGIIYICTMLAAIIFYNSAGSIAHHKNTTMEKYFTEKFEQLNTHVVVSEAFNLMQSGLSNFALAVFSFLLFISCGYTLLEYVNVIFLYATSFAPVRKFKRTTLAVCVCVLVFVLAIFCTTKTGYTSMMSIDKYFVDTGLLFILACELVTMVYFFGIRMLCDDIEFVLGFVPNYYYQVSWLVLPAMLLVVFAMSLIVKCRDAVTVYDTVSLTLMGLLVVMPVLTFATYKIIKAAKNKKFDVLFHPASFLENDNTEEPTSRSPSRRRPTQ